MRLNWNALSKYRSQIYALSILWVFVFHALYEDAVVKIFERVPYFVIKSGNLGVDVFLFMSGISMFFAMTKSDSVKNFYRRRFAKILKIYICFCIPYYIVVSLVGIFPLDETIRHITFTKQNVCIFWFLVCIMICYLIYPLIYRLICKGKQRFVLLGVFLYVAALGVFNYINQDAFLYDEIMLTRIPVFVAGCLAGKEVYEKKEMHPGVLFVFLIGILGKDVIKYLIAKIPVLEYHQTIVSRLYGGVIAVGMIFLMVILVQYLEGTVLNKWLIPLGTITLEFYVVHVGLRPVLSYTNFFDTTTRKGCLVYAAALFVLTLVISIILHKILGWIGKQKVVDKK